jgi:hypothetical protein
MRELQEIKTRKNETILVISKETMHVRVNVRMKTNKGE